MITDRYLQLALEIQQSDSFERLTSLLTSNLPEFIGGSGGFLFTVDRMGSIEGVYGAGVVAENTRLKVAQLETMFSREPFASEIDLGSPGAFGFSLSDYLSKEDVAGDSFLGSLEAEEQLKDFRFGMLNISHQRVTMLVVCSHSEVFNDEQKKLVDSLLLIARGTASTLARDSLQLELGKFYKNISPEARKAIFMVESNGEVLPFNYDALRLVEEHWKPDEAVRKLDDNSHEILNRAMAAAWRDPLAAEYTQVRLNLGLGDDEFYGVPGGAERIFLIHVLTDSKRLAEENLDAVLTRRQREIMEWTSEGKTSAETGKILGISPRTVEKHLEAIFERLGVENRITAVRRYLDLKDGNPL
jgi:DNA-binding CsgD family transcriptional regulator